MRMQDRPDITSRLVDLHMKWIFTGRFVFSLHGSIRTDTDNILWGHTALVGSARRDIYVSIFIFYR